MPQHTIVDLSSFDLLRVEGTDALRFLQGQATCDMQRLASEGVLPGAFCNTKGRIISAFHVLAVNDALYLQCPPGLGTVVEQHLAKFRVFFKVSITEASADWYRVAVVGPGALDALQTCLSSPLREEGLNLLEGSLAFRQTNAAGSPWQLWLPMKEKSPRLPPGMQEALGNDLNAWQLATLQAGQHFPALSQSELYTPEELNLDWSPAVSFTKGCYTGQEVVARMHYRGQGKKRLHRCRSQEAWPARLDAEAPAQLVTKDGKVLATLLAQALTETGALEGLAVIRTDSAGTAITLSADDIKVPGEILPLSFPES